MPLTEYSRHPLQMAKHPYQEGTKGILETSGSTDIMDSPSKAQSPVYPNSGLNGHTFYLLPQQMKQKTLKIAALIMTPLKKLT